MPQITLSILDLAPVPAKGTAAESLVASLALARRAEELGYKRYWFAEHHGMPSIASSVPELLIGYVAAGTTRIRVGSGGIMLPNHVPLKLAEAFHTLEALYPGRIDLGIGRAPGTDRLTMNALRPFDSELFPQQLQELVMLSRGDFPAEHPFHHVRVIPAGVSLPPVWILGSSGETASMAGSMGMGYSFASHFSPEPPLPAIRRYRESFQRSAHFQTSHVILGAGVVCAETDERAEYLAASMNLVWVRLQNGQFLPIPSPEEALSFPYTERERAVANARRALQIVGSPSTVRTRLNRLLEETGADELMIATTTFDHSDRVRSYELVAETMRLRVSAGV